MRSFQWIMGLALLAGSSVGVFVALKPSPEDRLRQENLALLRERQALMESIQRLTLENRIAEVHVIDQIKAGDPINGQPAPETITSIEFIEFNADGESLPSYRYQITGDVIYFDALVLKFQYEDVAAGDALKGKSLLLFRRIFGEYQNPSEGFLLDPEHEIPDVYRVNANPNDLEHKLWSRFWDYVADPVLRDRDGIRVVQGQAVYNRMERGQVWVLSHQTTGDLNLVLRKTGATSTSQPALSISEQG